MAVLIAELLTEIVSTAGVSTFDFNASKAAATAQDLLEKDKYFVFLARGNIEVGLITMHESHALYAEGTFGTIPELYVRAEYRSHGVGKKLLEAAREFGASRGWK